MPIPHKLTQKVARMFHDKGIELTPEQVTQTRKKAYATIRAGMKARGWILPEDDEHLLAIMVAMKRDEPILSRKTEAGTVLAHPDFVDGGADAVRPE